MVIKPHAQCTHTHRHGETTPCSVTARPGPAGSPAVKARVFLLLQKEALQPFSFGQRRDGHLSGPKGKGWIQTTGLSVLAAL